MVCRIQADDFRGFDVVGHGAHRLPPARAEQQQFDKDGDGDRDGARATTWAAETIQGRGR